MSSILKYVIVALFGVSLMGCDESPRDRALAEAEAHLERCYEAMNEQASMAVIRATCEVKEDDGS